MYIGIILLTIASSLWAAPSVSSVQIDSDELQVPKGVSTDAYLKKIIQFWTPEKMLQAKSVEEIYPDLLNQQVGNISNDSYITPFEDKMELILDDTAPDLPQSRVAYPSTRPTIGRVFWRVGSSLSSCSASIIPSDSKDVIITAGHCVHDGTRFLINYQWVFVPGYRNGIAPYGIWPARYVSALQTWTQSRNWIADVAMVSLSTVSGLHIQNYLGSHGLIFNAKIPGYNVAGSSSYITSLGYPGNLQNGEILQYCYTTLSLSPYTQGGFNGFFIRCDMGGGCSGGPWLNSANQVFSVNSFGITSLSYGNLNGPYLGQTMITLYDSIRTK